MQGSVASSQGARGPRMPFSLEHTDVPLPGKNPEDEFLAGASERQGATTSQPICCVLFINYEFIDNLIR